MRNGGHQRKNLLEIFNKYKAQIRGYSHLLKNNSIHCAGSCYLMHYWHFEVNITSFWSVIHCGAPGGITDVANREEG